MKSLIKKQFIKYCFYGTIAGLIEIVLFTILYNYAKLPLFVSNTIAFIISVLFSYYVNSKYVFKRTFLTRRKAIKQFNIFILSRIAGIFFDSSILYFCIHFISMPNLIAKTISCTSTALINYLIGKHIFKA